MSQQILQDFQKGVYLAKSSWIFFLFGLSLNLLGLVFALFLGHSADVYFANTILVSLIKVFEISFIISLPSFFVDIQNRSSFHVGHVLWVVWESIKRLMMSKIFIFLLLFWFVFPFFVYEWFRFQSATAKIWQFYPVRVIYACLFYLLVFTPIYFSLEKNSLFISIKKSIKFSFKHLYFIAVIFLIYTIIGFFFTSIPKFPAYKYYLVFTKDAVLYVISFLLYSTSLVLYQRSVKNPER